MAATTGAVRQALCKGTTEFLEVARIRALDELARAVRAGDAGMARRLSDLVIEIEERIAARERDEEDAVRLERRISIAARAGLPGGHFSA